jgi:tetratricopeptide (TPR) repeat protein
LLLDYWPLNRVEALRAEVGSTMRAFWRLALEKMPLFVLAFLSAVVTVVVQQQSGAVMDLQEFSFLVRLENAVLVVIMYLANAVWPSGLAVYYPHPGEAISHIFVSGALVAATGITALAMKYARRAPYLIVGWLWYLVTLAPVIGIVQVGDQAMADRYTYLPLIGPFIAVTWGIHDIASRSARFRRVAAAAAISAIAVLTVVAARQVQYWEGTETLWRRALAVTSENYRAHNNLGKALVDRGSLLDGERHLAEASRLRPDNAVYLNNWGLALVRFGDVDAAIGKFYRASELDGAFAEPRLNLGAAYATRGELRLAERHYREALIQSPDVPRVHYNLGLLDAEREMWTEAESHYRAALDRFPEYVDAHFDLGLALARQEKYPEADRHFEKTLQIRPNYQRTLMLFEGGEVDSGEIDLPSSRR